MDLYGLVNQGRVLDVDASPTYEKLKRSGKARKVTNLNESKAALNYVYDNGKWLFFNGGQYKAGMKDLESEIERLYAEYGISKRPFGCAINMDKRSWEKFSGLSKVAGPEAVIDAADIVVVDWNMLDKETIKYVSELNMSDSLMEMRAAAQKNRIMNANAGIKKHSNVLE